MNPTNASYCDSVSCVYSSSTSTLSTGAIIGIAVGVGSVVLIMAVILIVLCVRSSKRQAENKKALEEFQAQQAARQAQGPAIPMGYPAYPPQQPMYAAPPPPPPPPPPPVAHPM